MKIDALTKDVASQLERKKQTLTVAESCTGGLLSGQLTSLAGVSNVYLGGVVCYANALKISLLGVKTETLEKHGAVSRETALEMASGARLRLSSEWSVAITGIAGPSGGTKEKPVGTVWLAVVGPGFEEAVHQQFKGDREQIRNSAVESALTMLLTALNKN
jgi:nicotinamide-nucleotide amidase